MLLCAQSMHGRARFKDDPLRRELLALYSEVDALLAPYSCEGTTECCQFGVTGREPYPTAIELAEVHRAIAAIGGALKKRGLPIADETRRCPLLTDEGKCRIYEARPFGCRTFFCERVVGPTRKLPRDEIQRLARRIADLSARFAPRDPGARPLTRALLP
jgi:Fe-S-cluster containining protein